MPKVPFVSFPDKPELSILIRPLLKVVNPIELDEPPHRHTYQEIIWLKNGEGSHSIDSEVFCLKKNTLYMIYEGQIHYFIEGKNLEGYLIRFKNDFLNGVSILERTSGHYLGRRLFNELKLEDDESENIEKYLELMNFEFPTELNESKIQIVRNLLKAFLLKLESIWQEKLQNEIENNQTFDLEESIYLKFLHLLEKFYTKEKQINFYADKLGLSNRKLGEITRIFAGKPPKQLLTDRIVLEAKRLLIYTSTPLKDIVAQLGFEEISYFCRLFKEQTNQTPTQFKTNQIA